jgi:AmiR/NasT family two-component response regulator
MFVDYSDKGMIKAAVEAGVFSAMLEAWQRMIDLPEREGYRQFP